MALTILIDNIAVRQWRIDVENRRAIVSYDLMRSDGEPYKVDQTAIFWETVPDPVLDVEGNPIPNPDNWYQLPLAYSQLLTDLTVDIRSALLHLIGE